MGTCTGGGGNSTRKRAVCKGVGPVPILQVPGVRGLHFAAGWERTVPVPQASWGTDPGVFHPEDHAGGIIPLLSPTGHVHMLTHTHTSVFLEGNQLRSYLPTNCHQHWAQGCCCLDPKHPHLHQAGAQRAGFKLRSEKDSSRFYSFCSAVMKR